MSSTRAAEVSIHAVSPESILAVSCANAHGAVAKMAAADSTTLRRLAPDGRFLLSMSFPPFFRKKREQRWCHGLAQGVNRERDAVRVLPDPTVPAFRAKPVFCAAGRMTGPNSSPSRTTGVCSEAQPIALATIVSSLEQ